MREKTIFSKHIPLKEIDNANALIHDIELFNKIVHTACRLKTAARRSGKSERAKNSDGKIVDLRKKENKELREKQPPTIHMQMKNRFSTNDYFTNSACRTADAAIKSQEELSKLYTDNKKDKHDAVKKKRDKYNKWLDELKALKATMIERSKACKEGRKAPDPKLSNHYIWYDKKHDIFCLCSSKTDPNNKDWDVVWAWQNDYLFELQYLDPEIKKVESIINSLQKKYVRLSIEIERLKTEVRGICFGTRKLMKKRTTVYVDKKAWKSTWQKKRSKGMTLSGRKDAAGGNFMVRYIPETGILTYHAQNGTDVRMKVEFPHGQELVNKAVKADKKSRHPVAWRFERTHGSILVKCSISIDDNRMNDFYGDGCVSFDSNVDNISFAETNKHGNLRHHEIIKFDLYGKSSGERKLILSNALEVIFKYAQKVKKPVAAEDLKIKLNDLTYGSKKRNRILTGFAFRQILELAESKSYKYSIACTKVKPNNTSQIGKIKFARKYGLTIHEAAALAIGRRVMGVKEKMPPFIKETLSVKDLKLPRSKQWQKAYKKVKELTLKDVETAIMDWMKREELKKQQEQQMRQNQQKVI